MRARARACVYKPSTFPIQTVKLRVKRKAVIYNNKSFSPGTAAVRPGTLKKTWKRSIEYYAVADFRRLKTS